jgi:hypothetical protein
MNEVVSMGAVTGTRWSDLQNAVSGPRAAQVRDADYPSAETGSGADGPAVAPAGWETKHRALNREEEAPWAQNRIGPGIVVGLAEPGGGVSCFLRGVCGARMRSQ